MNPLDGGQLTTIRDGHPHTSTWRLSIHVPVVVYRGTINGDHDRGDRIITVTNVSGDLADAIAGNTVLFGTTSGGDDVARRRFRSRSGQDITIDENSNVWVAGQHVTILRDWEIWPVFPYIEPEEPYTFYKDRDRAYNDENLRPYPVPIMKDDQAGYLVSGSCVFPLNGSSSYAVADGATISSYSWSSTGGTIASPTSATTTITFTVAGTYWVYLTVTDSNGKSYTTRRLYYVHERTGANAPFLDFVVESPPTRSWRNGGSMVRLRVNANGGVATIPDRASILIWNEAKFDGDEEYFGDAGNVIFSGTVRSESVVVDQHGGYVSFEASTVNELLKRHKMFSVSLTDDPSPDTWWKYFKLTLPRAIHHLWAEHSTLLTRRDVILPIADARRVPAVDDFVEGDLYSLVESFALQHGIYAHVCCSCDNRVYVEEDVNILGQTARDAKPTIMEITKADRIGDVDITLHRQHELDTSFVFLAGVSYDGSETTPHISKAPGEVPETEGSGTINMERQIIADQDEANERSGRALAIANARLKDIRMKMAGNYAFMDVVPQAWYEINVAANENKRGIALVDQKIVPRNIVLDYNADAGTLFTSTTWDTEATGNDGVTGNFPTELPPPGPTPPAPSPIIGNLVLFNSTTGCYVHGSWLQRNGGLTGTNIQDRHGGVDPWWYTSGKQNTYNPEAAIMWKCDVGKLYRTEDRGNTWVNKTPSNNPPNDAGDSPAPTAGGVTYIQYEGNFFAQDQHVFIARWQNTDDEWRSWLLVTEDDGDSFAWLSLSASCGITIGQVNDFQDAINTGNEAAVGALTSTTVLAGYGKGEDQIAIRVGTVDGNEIQYSQEITLDVEGNAGFEPTVSQIVPLSVSTAVVIFKEYDGGGCDGFGRMAAVVVTYDGAQLIYGVVRSLDCSTRTRCAALTATKVVFSVPDDCVIGTITDTGEDATITLGTPVEWRSGQISLDVIRLTDTRFVVASGRYMRFGDVSGSVITYPQAEVEIIAENVTNTRLARFADDKFIVAFSKTSSTIVQALVCDITTNIDKGSVVTVETVTGAVRDLEIVGMDATTFALVYLVDNTTYSVRFAHGVIVDDTDLEFCQIDSVTGAEATTFNNLSATKLDATKVAIAYSRVTTGYGTARVLSLSGGDVKVLGLSISKGSGSYVFVTALRGSSLTVGIYELPSLAEVFVGDLGAATLEEVDANTYTARPFAGQISDNVCYIYGRLNDPASLGLCHVVRTVTGFSQISVVESGWGGDYCSAFVEGPLFDLNAVRNRGIGSYFYRGNASDGLFYKSQLPFRVNPGALAATIDKYVIVGGAAPAGSQMVLHTTFPFTAWTDITEDYPLSGSVTGLALT